MTYSTRAEWMPLLLGAGAAALMAGCSANHPGGGSPPIHRNRSETPAPAPVSRAADSVFDPPRFQPSRVHQEKRGGRLGYWRFDSPDLRGQEGQAPVGSSKATLAPSFEGTALSVESGPVPPLTYQEKEAGGQLNLDCRQGTVRLLYRRSPLRGARSEWGRLLEVGEWTPDASVGLFALSVDPSGGWVFFQTQDGEGHGTTNLSARVVWDGQWHEMTLVYSASETQLYVDGLKRGTGTGVKFSPPAAVRRRGFTVGSGGRGTLVAQGLVDELEIFDQPFGPAQLQNPTPLLRAEVETSPPGIRLRWRRKPSLAMSLERRAAGEAGWQLLTNHFRGWSFLDPDVEVGRAYEYQLFYTTLGGWKYFISSGIQLPPVESRGTVLLLVDETVAPALKEELDALWWDLAGDGWRVVRHDVPRHDDEVWSRNPPNIARIKGLVLSEYQKDPGALQTVFLVGHVSIPYSGYFAEDGHRDHIGAWPTDLYYGDVDGVWTDRSDKRSYTNFASQVNLPGDGKFDQTYIPANGEGVSKLELTVGRLDFAGLDIFNRDDARRYRPARTEVDLLRGYLNKNRRYRYKQLSFPSRLVVASHFHGGHDLDVYKNALSNGAAWFGGEPGWVVEGEPFPYHTNSTIAALWGFHGGGGWLDSSHAARRPQRTEHFAYAASEPSLGFVFMKGSYFPDWNLSRGGKCDNIFRATLAPPDSGLAAVAIAASGYWSMERLGMGAPVGDAVISSVNNTNQWPEGGRRSYALMGDPTLRMEVVSPPARLKWRKSREGEVVLRWNPPDEPGVVYLVDRSMQGRDGPFVRLNADPLQNSDYADREPGAGPKLYRVRAARLTISGSGSYTNLSQGLFALVD